MVEAIETAFAPWLATLDAAADASLLVSERTGLALATVMARAGRVPAVVDAMHLHYGLKPVNQPCRVASGARAMVGIGPGNWLYVGESASGTPIATLADRLAGLASVFDQSSGYAVLRVEGEAATGLIGKGAFIDLHPAAFPPGSAAVTVIAHIDAMLWRLDDTSFEIAVFRSFAGSFWHWLTATAAAMGVAPRRSDPILPCGDENASG